MKYPFFASFIVFCIWLTYELRKSSKAARNKDASFWEKEAEANATRRRPLDDLDYIYFHPETLPMDLLSDHPDIAACQNTLKGLSDKTIVNFTGISNTDLKLKYGAPNLDLLSEYDENFETLIKTLQTYGSLLFENSCRKEAASVLEYAIHLGSDIPASYRLLARIYKELDQKEHIPELVSLAGNSSIPAPRKEQLVTFLEGMAN